MSKQSLLSSFLPTRKKKKEFDFTSSWGKEATYVSSNQQVEPSPEYSATAMLKSSARGRGSGIKMTPELMERLNETKSVRERDLLAIDVGDKV